MLSRGRGLEYEFWLSLYLCLLSGVDPEGGSKGSGPPFSTTLKKKDQTLATLVTYQIRPLNSRAA